VGWLAAGRRLAENGLAGGLPAAGRLGTGGPRAETFKAEKEQQHSYYKKINRWINGTKHVETNMEVRQYGQ
jgi:hypothetical protein